MPKFVKIVILMNFNIKSKHLSKYFNNKNKQTTETKKKRKKN